MPTRRVLCSIAVLMVGLLVVLPAAAQDGKLKIKVTPKEAYVFIDGQAKGDGSHTYRLSPGSHQVSVHNYGYRAKSETVNITAGETTRLEVALDAVPGTLSAPWGRIQIEGAGRSVVFATDTEHPEAGVDERLASFAGGASCLIYDATFTPEEYASEYRGWGHSTWQAGTEIARRAGVEKLLLSHFNPDHSDRKIRDILRLARKNFPRTDCAREGLRLKF